MPFRCFTDFGKMNFLTRIDYRIKLHLETEMKRLFESRKVLTSKAALPMPDANCIYQSALHSVRTDFA